MAVERIEANRTLEDKSLYREFAGPLLNFFRRRARSAEEADDLVQQMFVQFISAKKSQIEDASAYVFTIAANILCDHHRSAVRRREAAGDGRHSQHTGATTELAENRSPERVLLGKESLCDVLAALDELGEQTRSMFILFRLENVRQAEIAALTMLSAAPWISTLCEQLLKFGGCRTALDCTIGFRRINIIVTARRRVTSAYETTDLSEPAVAARPERLQ